MVNFVTFYWHQGCKRIPTNLGCQFATLGANVLTFINIVNVLAFFFWVAWGRTTSQNCPKLA
jgi:hypothetical protein